ncbi:hypothetical protein [Nocardia asteroides]|uniref:hypothetical protein n=1 Tax=Nocardia asteroides TaxID=1824 RepID=UPI001E37ACB1|nr:hypothetical protein [Nocardia asteroides]UGT59171.1 hypothetical protein LTT61_17935 [Nocardia asteroides]
MTTAYPAPHEPRFDYGRPPPPPPPGRRPLNAADTAIAIVLYALAFLLALCSVFATMFFAFAADSCTLGRDCDFIGTGMIVSWGGAGLGVLVGAVMLPIAAWQRWPMWVWGVLSLALVVGGFGIGIGIVSGGLS